MSNLKDSEIDEISYRLIGLKAHVACLQNEIEKLRKENNFYVSKYGSIESIEKRNKTLVQILLDKLTQEERKFFLKRCTEYHFENYDYISFLVKTKNE